MRWHGKELLEFVHLALLRATATARTNAVADEHRMDAECQEDDIREFFEFGLVGFGLVHAVDRHIHNAPSIVFLAVATDEGKRKDSLPVVLLVLQELVNLLPHLVAEVVLVFHLFHLLLHVELREVFGMDVDNLTRRVAVLLGDGAVLDDGRCILVHITLEDALPCYIRIVRTTRRRVVARKDEVRRPFALVLAVGILLPVVGTDAGVTDLLTERFHRTVRVKGRDGRDVTIVHILHRRIEPCVAYIHIVDAVLLVHAFQAGGTASVVVDADNLRCPSGIIRIACLLVELQFREADAVVTHVACQVRIHEVEVGILHELLYLLVGSSPNVQCFFRRLDFFGKLCLHLTGDFLLHIRWYFRHRAEEIEESLALVVQITFEERTRRAVVDAFGLHTPIHIAVEAVLRFRAESGNYIGVELHTNGGVG